MRTVDDFVAAQRYSDAAVLDDRRPTLGQREYRTITGDWYFKHRGWWWVRDSRGRVAATYSPNVNHGRVTADQYLEAARCVTADQYLEAAR